MLRCQSIEFNNRPWSSGGSGFTLHQHVVLIICPALIVWRCEFVGPALTCAHFACLCATVFMGHTERGEDVGGYDMQQRSKVKNQSSASTICGRGVSVWEADAQGERTFM